MPNRFFTAFCLRIDEELGPARFGFTVPRSLGKAVERNRMKRRMREAVRTQLATMPDDWAIVFNPKRAVLDASFENLCREIGRVLVRCRES